MSRRELAPKTIKRLRLAAVLLAGGMAVQASTLIWSHPTAFLIFAFVGCFSVGVGTLVYLSALAS
jgi:hypothetical protein